MQVGISEANVYTPGTMAIMAAAMSPAPESFNSLVNW